MPIDPVCKSTVKKRLKHKYNGNDFYFCSNECREEFSMDPEMYLVSIPTIEAQALEEVDK